MLQWGRRNYPAETEKPPKKHRGTPASFNGAAGITRRKQAPSHVMPVNRSLGFNGAAGITRRKLY